MTDAPDMKYNRLLYAERKSNQRLMTAFNKRNGKSQPNFQKTQVFVPSPCQVIHKNLRNETKILNEVLTGKYDFKANQTQYVHYGDKDRGKPVVEKQF